MLHTRAVATKARRILHAVYFPVKPLRFSR